MTTVSQWLSDQWDSAAESADSVERAVRDALEGGQATVYRTLGRVEGEAIDTGFAVQKVADDVSSFGSSTATAIGNVARDTANTIKWVMIGIAVVTGLIVLAAIVWMFGLLKVAGDAAPGIGVGLGRGLAGA
jgi:hypothetical protein